MNKNKIRTLIGLAIVFVIYTLIVFLPPFNRNNIFWISYVFSVIAFGALAFILNSAFFSREGLRSKFYGYPIARIGLIYLAVQIALSFLFIVISRSVPQWLVVIVFVIVLGAAAIGFIATDAVREEIEAQDSKLSKNTDNMQTLRSIVASMSGSMEDSECSTALRNLSDEFKYSDPVSHSTTLESEGELKILVEELQNATVNNDISGVKDLCKRISSTLADRNRIAKLNKGK